MKAIIKLLLISTLLVSYTNPKDPNKILWSKDYLLQWNDFKGSVKQIDETDAYTYYSIEYRTENNKLGVFCYFEKNKSWRIKKKETYPLLKHEQYHFNIAEVFTRKFRKQILELKIEKNSKEIEKKFNKIVKELAEYQKTYDKKTDHSRISEEQAKWEKDIDKQLQELNDYSSPLIE